MFFSNTLPTFPKTNEKFIKVGFLNMALTPITMSRKALIQFTSSWLSCGYIDLRASAVRKGKVTISRQSQKVQQKYFTHSN